MIDVYFWPTPNGYKVTVMLEELGLKYNLIPVNIGKGDQFKPEFLKISPNNRMPAIVDHEGPGGKPFAIFESGAILMYLAEKYGKLMPTETRGKYQVVEWLMFQMASVGPMLGQAHHFRLYAPEKLQYAIDRYTNEARRIYNVNAADVWARQLIWRESTRSRTSQCTRGWCRTTCRGRISTRLPISSDGTKRCATAPRSSAVLRSWPMKSRRCARPPRLANGRTIRSRGTICSATGSSKRDSADPRNCAA